MRYGLTRLVLESNGFVALSEEEFETIKEAQENLFEALFIEENFDLVVENYLEFEIDLLSAAARQMIHAMRKYDQYQEERRRINRRIANVLTACRSYLDQTGHHLSEMFGRDSAIESKFQQGVSEQYERCAAYRVMYALRNYVQHRAYPIHCLTYPTQWVGDDHDKLLFSLTPLIYGQELETDFMFNETVINDLKALGEKIDVRPLMREYVSALGRIHEALRALLSSEVQEWEKIILGTIKRFCDAFPEERSTIGLTAVLEDDRGKHLERIVLFDDFIKYRHELERKTPSLVNLAKRYVTGEVTS